MSHRFGHDDVVTGTDESRHIYYDHATVAGEPVCELRDALVDCGWDARVVHTGGGCMNVAVLLRHDLGALTGPEPGYYMPDGSIARWEDATEGGLSLEEYPSGEYLGNVIFGCDRGSFLAALDHALEQARDGDVSIQDRQFPDKP